MAKKPRPAGRVIVAMSGGVDSSVAAVLLLRQGYEVIGVTMRLWTQEDPQALRHHRRCCSVEDSDEARAVCHHLGIPHYVLNLEREFARSVVDYFLAEYARGRTPNPCLACNQEVKFRPLLAMALALGADYLATGHYARIRPYGRPLRASASGRRNGNGLELWKAADAGKDQSYVLCTLGQEELSRLLFPVGEYSKEEIRRLARETGLPNAEKPDSAEICFITNGDYRSFVAPRVRSQPGDIVDTAGRRLGRHPGLVHYTVGQRKGLPPTNRGYPLYVLRLDAATNTVLVGPEEELLSDVLVAERLSFVSGRPPPGPIEVEAKIRYRSEASPALLTVFDGHAEVRFAKPQRAVTPGQAVAFYQGEKVVGGGIIVSNRRTEVRGAAAAAPTLVSIL